MTMKFEEVSNSKPRSRCLDLTRSSVTRRALDGVHFDSIVDFQKCWRTFWKFGGERLHLCHQDCHCTFSAMHFVQYIWLIVLFSPTCPSPFSVVPKNVSTFQNMKLQKWMTSFLNKAIYFFLYNIVRWNLHLWGTELSGTRRSILVLLLYQVSLCGFVWVEDHVTLLSVDH